MDIFEKIEKWKKEHSDEWEQIEEYIKVLDELGIRRRFGPEPLRPGYEYDYEVSDTGTCNLEI